MAASKREQLLELRSDDDVELLCADGFDDAIVGVTADHKHGVDRVVYDREKCIQILVDRDGMDWSEAEEFFQYNTERSLPYMGDGGPLFVEILLTDGEA